MRPRHDGHGEVRRIHRTAPPGGHMVYVVHPGALPADVYRPLADALPEGCGLTVLDVGALADYARAAWTGGHAATTVEALAASLLDLLDETSGGPDGGAHTLAGWSFGGVLALAMTHLMPAEQRPARLVLLDSIAPTEEYKQPDDALEPGLLLGWFAMYLGAKRGRPVPVDPARLAGCSVDEGLVTVLDLAVASGALLPDTPLPGLRKLYDTYVDGLLRNNRLTAVHDARPAELPLVMVKAERSLVAGDPALGWGPLAPHGLAVHGCPGDHYTMLSRPDSVAVIAELVRPV
ncbi:thioesterase domain-containing protein [Streptomyces sp. NPDC014344]|uniref:thioesterase domain-containing protein n=1 Tax=Streptomyces sp. NPDC014344 TaxID=3364871 RepID=UPI0036FD6AE6